MICFMLLSPLSSVVAVVVGGLCRGVVDVASVVVAVVVAVVPIFSMLLNPHCVLSSLFACCFCLCLVLVCGSEVLVVCVLSVALGCWLVGCNCYMLVLLLRWWQ